MDKRSGLGRDFEDFDLDAHVLVHLVDGRGMGVHRCGVAEALIAEMGGVEALLDQVVIDELSAFDRQDEQRVFRRQRGAGRIAKAVYLEIAVAEAAEIVDASRQGFARGVRKDGSIGDEVDVVECDDCVGFTRGTRRRRRRGIDMRDGRGFRFVVIDDDDRSSAEAVVAGKGFGLAMAFETRRYISRYGEGGPERSFRRDGAAH